MFCFTMLSVGKFHRKIDVWLAKYPAQFPKVEFSNSMILLARGIVFASLYVV